MNHDDRFLKKEYYKNLFPVIFSVLGGTINALIDSIFVSQKLGENGLAAVNMSMPVYLVLCTFGSLIAAGASVMSAQAAGQEKMDDAASHYHTALTLSILIGAVLSVAGWLFCQPIASLLSQNGDLQQYVYAYCLITFVGTLPTLLSYMPLYYLQLEGKTKAITVTMLLMMGVDVFLDWLLMFCFDLGMYGAALASLISCVIACTYSYIAMEQGYSNYHFRICELTLSQCRDILRFGSPAALGNFVDAVKLLALNSMILHMGGATAAAVWAVLNSMSELSVSVTSGVPQAAAPMIGAYFTARENSGLRILMKLQASSGLIISVGYAIVLVLLYAPLGSVFNVTESLLFPFVCLGLLVVLDLICNIWITFFHATGRLILSDVLVICRKLIFPVGAAAIVFFSGGYMWLFMPVGSVLTVLTGLLLTGVLWQKQTQSEHPLSRLLLLDDYLEREKKVLDFSIVPTNENICQASEQIKDFCVENNMNSRQTMKLELSIEELLTIMTQKNPNLDSVDLRAFALEKTMGIRIRCAGNRYNPFEPHPESEDEMMMGVNMLMKMSQDVSFTYALGMNIINIMFEMKNS